MRGGGVVAWDNNETRGTLGIRGTRSAHRNTTRELLQDLDRFRDVHQSRIGDLGSFVRSQGDAHFDVLASDERPDVTGVIHASDFREVHALLERFYRIILVDTRSQRTGSSQLVQRGTGRACVGAAAYGVGPILGHRFDDECSPRQGAGQGRKFPNGSTSAPERPVFSRV